MTLKGLQPDNSLLRSAAAFTACINAPATACFSMVARAAMVVPPGLATRLCNWAGWAFSCFSSASAPSAAPQAVA